MNIELKKVKWADGNAPSTPQTLRLSFRRQDAPDVSDSYTLVTDSLFVLANGTIINPPLIKGLENAMPYVLRLQNNDIIGGQVDILYTTPSELAFAQVTARFTPNARIDYVNEGINLLSGMMPSFGKAFFTLENDFIDRFATYSISPGAAPAFKKYQGYLGLYVNAASGSLTTNISQPNLIGYNGAAYYSMGVNFYISTADLGTSGVWPLLSCVDASGNGVMVYVDNATKKVVWQQKNPTARETLTSTTQIVPDSWNNVLIGSAPAPIGNNVLYHLILNGSNNNTGSIGTSSNFSTPNANEMLSVGGNPYPSGFSGKGTFRNLYVTAALSSTGDNSGYTTLLPPTGYLQQVSNPANIITIPHENMISVSSTKISFTIPQSVAAGNYNFYVKYNRNTSTTPVVNISVDAVTKQTSPFDFNFALSDDTLDMTDAFQVAHYAISENLDGGPDGGVVPKNVYFRDGMLVLEAHGDLYDGLVQGVDKDRMPKKHTEPGDPLIGEYWKTRVGAAVATRSYCGYGRFIVEAKLPKQFGVSPFFRLYNRATAFLQDPYYDQVIASGLHQRSDGANGYYTIVKNEFSMELPANNSVWVFNSLSEMVSVNYVYPYAGMKVIVNAGDNNDGTWQLNTPAAPNQLSSWTKFSDEKQLVNQPRRDQVKLKNSKGPLGNGAGFNWLPNPVEEEYLEMRASAGKDIWDDAFHEFRMDWYANRVEYYIDGVLIQTNPFVVPDIAGRFSFGLSFPSSQFEDSSWLLDPQLLTAGVAAWHHQTMTVRRVAFTPFTDAVAGGTNRLIGETKPYDGMYKFPFIYG
ncbi:hypothetical protein [Chitinophaga sancti]|uniref:hypothetical protein n=1 Tax=Chitinophaga sancti TaxID=1004 RepID=UPI003F78F2BD